MMAAQLRSGESFVAAYLIPQNVSLKGNGK